MLALLENLRISADFMTVRNLANLRRRYGPIFILRHAGVGGAWLATALTVALVRMTDAVVLDDLIVADHSSGFITRAVAPGLRAPQLSRASRVVRPTLRERMAALFETVRDVSAARTIRDAITPEDATVTWLRMCMYFARLALWNQILERRPAAVALPDDLSPERVAIGVSANTLNLPVGYFLMPGHERPRAPFRVDVLFTQSSYQLDRYKGAAAICAVKGVEQRPYRTSRLREKLPIRIGIALNAWADEPIVQRIVEEARDAFVCQQVVVRLHPRSSVRAAGGGRRFVIDRSDRPIEDFAMECDLVVSGDTTAVEEILVTGTPVITTGDLDNAQAAPYRDVLGRVPVVGRPLCDIRVEAIADHYDALSSIPHPRSGRGLLSWDEGIDALRLSRKPDVR